MADNSVREIPLFGERAVLIGEIFFPHGQGNGGLAPCSKCKKKMVFGRMTCDECFEREYGSDSSDEKSDKSEKSPKTKRMTDPSVLEIPIPDSKIYYDTKYRILFPNGRGNGGLADCSRCTRRVTYSRAICDRCSEDSYIVWK